MKIILSILFLSVCLVGYSQIEGIDPTARYRVSIEAPPNTERYGIDYILKDYTFVNGDSSILELLNLDAIEYLRAQDHAVEVFDESTGLIIILFHEKRKPGTVNSLLINE